MTFKSILAALILSTTLASAQAEDLNQIFQKVNQYVGEKNYAKALSELTWAKKEIEKLHSTKIQEFLPADLAGLTGAPIAANSALGIMNVERKYTRGSEAVTASITGGAGGGDAAAGFAGLAQLGAMAAAFGAVDPGTETFRILGRTATLKKGNSGSNPELTLSLQGGALIKLEGNNATKSETLKAMAEALKLDDLDAYLKS